MRRIVLFGIWLPFVDVAIHWHQIFRVALRFSNAGEATCSISSGWQVRKVGNIFSLF